jgi:hypothetical protein
MTRPSPITGVAGGRELDAELTKWFDAHLVAG